MTQSFPEPPEDSVQWFIKPDSWWIEAKDNALRRGRLIRTFVPHVDQDPFVLVPEGRTDPQGHGRADYRVEPFNVKASYAAPKIPIAGLPHRSGEKRFIYRGKVRPALVLSAGGADVPTSLVSSSARWITAKTLIVGPYFGADQEGSRGGWPPPFVERIRRAEYPQYVWDSLPLSDVNESILRLDQMKAVGRSATAIEILPYSLSYAAMLIVDEWLTWLLKGGLPEDGFLHGLRKELLGTNA